MKSHRFLFEKIAARETLVMAMRNAARGKLQRNPVIKFLADSENEIERLRLELQEGAYRPRPCTQFKIKDPKPRLISCADFRDRVVHHALCAVISPILERRFISDSYACRKGKGVHKAVLRANGFQGRAKYFLKTDIKKFYDSVSHEVLLEKLLPMFRESEIRELISTIVKHPLPGQKEGRGLPIGNLTSQWFANFYLDSLDHFIKEKLRVRYYVRYMDDFVLWGDSKDLIYENLADVSEFLNRELRLELNMERTIVSQAASGLPFLGMLIYPKLIRFQNKKRRRALKLFRKRKGEYVEGDITERSFIDSSLSIFGAGKLFGLKIGFSEEMEI